MTSYWLYGSLNVILFSFFFRLLNIVIVIKNISVRADTSSYMVFICLYVYMWSKNVWKLFTKISTLTANLVLFHIKLCKLLFLLHLWQYSPVWDYLPVLDRCLDIFKLDQLSCLLSCYVDISCTIFVLHLLRKTVYKVMQIKSTMLSRFPYFCSKYRLLQ